MRLQKLVQRGLEKLLKVEYKVLHNTPACREDYENVTGSSVDMFSFNATQLDVFSFFLYIYIFFSFFKQIIYKK